MKIFHERSIDSTSSLAARKIKEGCTEAFCILADEQTGGRGRSGNVWHSPVGGIYLTLALPTQLELLRNPGFITLGIGEAAAAFVLKEFGIRISVKWPNDLYHGGKKCGGILTESIPMAGSSQLMLLVGIGLNVFKPMHSTVQTIAATPGAGTSAAESITYLNEMNPLRLGDDSKAGPTVAITGKLQEKAVLLARHLEYSTLLLLEGGIKPPNTADWQSQSRPGLKIWYSSGEDAWWWVAGLGPAGEMQLSPLFGPRKEHGKEQPQTTAVHSANHGLQCFVAWPHVKLADMATPHIWLADQGNTSTKIYSVDLSPLAAGTAASPLFTLKDRISHALAPGQSLGEDGDHGRSALKKAVESLFKDHDPERQRHLIFLASVYPSAENSLKSVISTTNRQIEVIVVEKRPVRLQTSYDLETLGIDRLALMEGALDRRAAVSQASTAETAQTRFSENQTKGILIASSGTALTVDAIKPSGEHLGGWICPGFDMQLRSLSAGTARLPQVSLAPAEGNGDEPMPLLGLGTASSMRAGIRQGTRLALDALRNRLEAEHGHQFELLLTGWWPGDDRETMAYDLMPHGIWRLVIG